MGLAAGDMPTTPCARARREKEKRGPVQQVARLLQFGPREVQRNRNAVGAGPQAQMKRLQDLPIPPPISSLPFPAPDPRLGTCPVPSPPGGEAFFSLAAEGSGTRRPRLYPLSNPVRGQLIYLFI